MGFLQADTNNIILDAVLTDIGRQFLARNDGSFSIVKFALGDDDVDYSVIQKFGRTVGKEKIEKNTPVLEAQTVGNLAQKFRLVSVSNPNLVRLPNVILSAGATNDLVTLGRNLNKTATLTLQQQIQDESEINPELRDQIFIVEMNNLFLRVVNTEPDNIDSSQRATYLITRDSVSTALQGSKTTFTLSVQSITDAQFDVFGQTSSGSSTKNIIRTIVRVSGVNSGAVKEFTVQISRTS
jgi:hypothetical protein